MERQAKEQQTNDFLLKISSQAYHVSENSIELFSVSKSKTHPITTFYIPVFHSPSLVTLLSLNGYEKDYPTLLVELMVQKFTEGFFNRCRLNGTTIQQNQLNHLFLTLLERFSPDIYQIAFTFSLTTFDLQQNKIYFHGLHQSKPFVIENNGKADFLQGQKIEIKSELEQFITAMESEIRPGQWICLYQSEAKPVHKKVYEDLFVPALENNQFDLQKALLQLEDVIKSEEQDKSFVLIKIK